MDRGGGQARGNAAQPGRGQLGRARGGGGHRRAIPAGRQVDGGVRAAEGTGRARALSLRSRAEKRSRGDAQKHPTHRAAEAGSGQEPTRGDPSGGARAGGGSERQRAGGGRLGPGCVAPVGRARRSARPGPGPGAPRAGRSGRRSGAPNAQASGPGGRPGPSGAPGSQAAPLRSVAREGASRRLLQRRLLSAKRLSWGAGGGNK